MIHGYGTCSRLSDLFAGESPGKERRRQEHRAGGRCEDPLSHVEHRLQEPDAPRPAALRPRRARQQARSRQGYCRLYLHGHCHSGRTR